MAETNGTVAPEDVKREAADVIAESPFATPVSVSRNGVTIELEPFVGQKPKSKWFNKAYAAVQATPDNLVDVLKFVGDENTINIINTWLRRTGQDYYENSIGADGTPEEGRFILDAFKNEWQNLAAAGMKISELEESIDEEQKKFMKFIMETFTPELMASHTTEARKSELKAQSEKLTTRINGLRQQLARRQSKRSKEVNTNEVRPES